MFHPTFPTALIDCDPSFDILERSIKSVFLGKRDSCSTKLQFPQLSTEISVNESCAGNELVTLSSSPDLLETPKKESSASQICQAIEKSMTKAIKVIGNDLWQSEIKSSKGRSRVAKFVIDRNGEKRRYRRKPEQLTSEKNHHCPYYSCDKTYTSKCSLYLHMKRHHTELELVKDGSEIPATLNSRVKKGVDVFKVFKKGKALDYSQVGCTTVRPESSIFGDDVIFDISPLLECKKKRLFSEIKFDRTKSKSRGEENFSREGGPKIKRFLSMTGEQLSMELPSEPVSPALRSSEQFAYEAQNEIFSCEFSKMRTSDIVHCQYKKNLQNDFEATSNKRVQAADDFGSMGVSFDDHKLCENSDSENFKNARFSDFHSAIDYNEDSQGELFKDREDFCAKFNESGQMMENNDFIDFENRSFDFESENAFELNFG
jgi:hypothetical protein